MIRDKKKMLHRVKRLQGQLSAIEKALLEERGCSAIQQMIAACHGAMKGLMIEVLEGHIRCHVLNPDIKPSTAQSKAAQELIDILRTYVR
jgi:FrmR/RcnR family transcriptional regulator, repressor of frmRAB operon